jgi:sulfate permease, SulP family
MTTDPIPMGPANRRKRSASNFLPSLAAGVVIALSAIFTGIGVAALAFPGDLQKHLHIAIGSVLFSAIVLAVISSLWGSRPGILSLPQETPAAILGLMAGSLAAPMSASLPPEETVAAVSIAMGAATIITGLSFTLLGQLRLGGLIRFIPYPVVGGVLAGMGWLLIKGALSVLIPAGLIIDPNDTTTIVQLATGLLFGIALIVLMPRIKHYLALPALLLFGTAGFHLSAVAVGTEISDLLDAGWLLGPFPAGTIWSPPEINSITSLDWRLVAAELPVIATVVLVSVISILLYASSIELVVRTDIDLNHDLRIIGAANMITGLGGGVPGFHSMSDTMLAQQMGALNRMTGIFASIVLIGVLLLGIGALSYFPRAVLGGLLFYLAFQLLYDWVVTARKSLPLGDYGIIIAMLIVSAWFGYLQAIGLGLIAGVILFVLTYSRLDVAKFSASGNVLRSNVDRPEGERRCLEAHGDRIFVVCLQGYLFFGTSQKILQLTRERLDEDGRPLSFLVLDFRLVNGLDSSAIITFRKLVQLAEDLEFKLYLTNLPDRWRTRLANGGLAFGSGSIDLAIDLDHGLEHCEELVLKSFGGTVVPEDRTAGLSALPAWLSARLEDYLEIVHYPAGTRVIHQGEPSNDMYFVRKGRVAVRLEPDGPAKESALLAQSGPRLRAYGPGTILGEIAMYLGTPRSASIIAETNAVLLRLSREGLERITHNDPHAAAEIHRFVARSLCERFTATNHLLQSVT